MFVTQEFEVARNANAEALHLLEKRPDLIQSFGTHSLAAHNDSTLDDLVV